MSYIFSGVAEPELHVALGYISGQQFFLEYVRLEPSGLVFHQKNYNTLREVLFYFSKNYMVPRYTEEMNKATFIDLEALDNRIS